MNEDNEDQYKIVYESFYMSHDEFSVQDRALNKNLDKALKWESWLKAILFLFSSGIIVSLFSKLYIDHYLIFYSILFININVALQFLPFFKNINTLIIVSRRNFEILKIYEDTLIDIQCRSISIKEVRVRMDEIYKLKKYIVDDFLTPISFEISDKTFKNSAKEIEDSSEQKRIILENSQSLNLE